MEIHEYTSYGRSAIKITHRVGVDTADNDDDEENVIYIDAIRSRNYVNDHTLILQRIWVPESYRRRGWGTKLLSCLLETCKTLPNLQGVSKIRADVLDEAIEFYKKSGFTQCGDLAWHLDF
jgi:GNAT superfamily N-acetyltransferase